MFRQLTINVVGGVGGERGLNCDGVCQSSIYSLVRLVVTMEKDVRSRGSSAVPGCSIPILVEQRQRPYL